MKLKVHIKLLPEPVAISRRGITIVELVVSMAILMVVAAPFLGTFISSTKNNQLSQQILDSSTLSQKIMEEIKARPFFLSTEADTDLDAEFKEYGVYGEYIVKYKIVKEEGILSELADTYEYNDISSVAFDMEYSVKSSQVKVDSDSYSLYSGINPYQFKLKISENDNRYTFKLSNDLHTDLRTDVKTINGSEPLRIKIQYMNGCTGEFLLQVDCDGIIDEREVYFYIVDDKKDSMVLQNIGRSFFYKYDKLSTSQTEYRNVLYNIEVVVEKDGEETGRLASSVKK